MHKPTQIIMIITKQHASYQKCPPVTGKKNKWGSDRIRFRAIHTHTHSRSWFNRQGFTFRIYHKSSVIGETQRESDIMVNCEHHWAPGWALLYVRGELNYHFKHGFLFFSLQSFSNVVPPPLLSSPFPLHRHLSSPKAGFIPACQAVLKDDIWGELMQHLLCHRGQPSRVKDSSYLLAKGRRRHHHYHHHLAFLQVKTKAFLCCSILTVQADTV